MNSRKTLKKVSSAQFVHRWLMLLLAIPIFIWGLTGSYFVLMDIGFIRSDHIVIERADKIRASAVKYPIAKVYQSFPEARKITLTVINTQLIYQVKLTDQSLLIDAASGQQLAAISKSQAEQISQSFQHQQSISPTAQIQFIGLLNDKTPLEQLPSELAARHLPVWRVVFDDIGQSTLYISAQTGEVVTRRHEYWRLFDLFWKWHIMDYDDGEAIDNQLLFYTAIASFIAVFAGGLLVWQRRKRYS
ncbi:peptidase [Shewanella electrodiphila]|uniref:Peptidase n=1 Tax=Shewanella electrodiphila TaxID=934143 RepID=A0ABT0KVF5_9GAMM|nr:peptidase [Shewanella electrodiphila]MCL1047546.1 peptidase [Shewanella electrodiphila]